MNHFIQALLLISLLAPSLVHAGELLPFAPSRTVLHKFPDEYRVGVIKKVLLMPAPTDEVCEHGKYTENCQPLDFRSPGEILKDIKKSEPAKKTNKSRRVEIEASGALQLVEDNPAVKELAHDPFRYSKIYKNYGQLIRDVYEADYRHLVSQEEAAYNQALAQLKSNQEIKIAERAFYRARESAMYGENGAKGEVDRMIAAILLYDEYHGLTEDLSEAKVTTGKIKRYPYSIELSEKVREWSDKLKEFKTRRSSEFELKRARAE